MYVCIYIYIHIVYIDGQPRHDDLDLHLAGGNAAVLRRHVIRQAGGSINKRSVACPEDQIRLKITLRLN